MSTTVEAVDTEPVENLWSSILDSVSSTRSIPSKQVLILGEKSSGRSTIAAGLLGRQLDTKPEKTDFALGYDWADVKDDADEDTLARLSVYTVPSSSPTYLSLLPVFLPPRTSLPHTLVMIIMDWTRPWSFVEQLELWLTWIETWAKGDGARELEIVREESRERLQSHLQHYTEPSSSTDPPLPTTSALSGTLLPLGPGTLTHNASGVPVVVVCTKADLIDEGHDIVGGSGGMGGMVKGKGGEWEERTDGVMQVLRTICLKYGAGLFYTTQQPQTLSTLRHYVLHLLFAPPAPSPIFGSTDVPAPARNPFPFFHKPNTLDRDRILVPAGWDSWGKITVLREGFDAKAWGEAWERDLDEERDDNNIGAKEMFMSIVGTNQDAKPTPLPQLISPTPEQQFLAIHYESNAKSSDRDPRQTFRTPADPSNLTGAGVVGPLESSSFNLPTVERALVEMEGGGSNERNIERDPRRSSTDPAGRPPSTLSSTGTSSTHAHPHARPPASPSIPNAPVVAGQSQHDVLQNFFQSLLSSRDRTTSTGSGTGSGTGTGAGQSEGNA
ncbi:dynein light intermediate chain-domain-containing protein [Hysterangium stoloniferum]|nr:dynein light intermediate chain-domain-containing protein [Hysterangium stoloniferum]